ncbi:hypothetical protein [Streptomyces laculatispora]|uniref:hypothetical protein n=1 Tax=Streptomyces laculatispora TaxID=887464 RepID=UPI001A9528FC|nr:hypothetical protein [Streptomyces laculatispora]MBO0913273.1 hypothetical protein [Streptomyces laculatispora]
MRKAVASIAGGTMLLAGFMATPAGATAPSTVASQPTKSAVACTHFYRERAEGATEGDICGNVATGWVRDDRADGRCPFTRFWDRWTNKEVDSPQAGPKGTTITFRVATPTNNPLLGYASIEWRSC